MVKKRSSSDLSVKIENNSNPSVQINNSLQQSGIMNPSALPFNPSFIEKDEQQKLTQSPTLKDKIQAILDIKPEHRNALHNKNLRKYQPELTKNSKQQSELCFN